MKISQLLLFFCLTLTSAYAQKGPGGVGNSDGANGQPELYLWLLPDSLGLSDGADVITWGDYSGKSQDLTAFSATAPILMESGINGHDYLEFSKNNNRIVSNPFDMPTDAVSVFTVLRTTDSGDALLSYAVPGSDNEYLLFQSNDPRTYIHGGNTNMGSAYNDGNWKIFSHQWRNTDGRLLLHLDGTQAGSATLNSGATLDAGGAFAIGGEQDAVDGGYQASQAFQGSIAEVIIYGSSLKKAERTVVENYLAQKYGLDGNLPTDLFTPPEASYIVGMSGMGKESDGTTKLNSSGLVITQNGNFVDGDYVFAAHDGTANAVNSTPNTLYAEVEAAWQRDWYVDKTGNVNVKLAFDLSAGIDGDYPANIQNYRLLYKSNVGDSYDTLSVGGRGVQNGDQLYFSVDDAQFSDGYYTLGTVSQTDSPLDGVEGRTWYTLISGDWDSWEVWTLDPSGALPNNPEQLTPSTSSTSNADNVVVLTGKTVTVSTNNKTHSSLTVDGRLDFQSTSGHSFGEIKGRGRILLSGDNFPGGDATHFITEGQGEGTVEYYGTSFLLNQSLEFYDLTLDMDDAAQTLTLLADYTVNGNLRIKQGDFQINDNTSTTNLNINVTGNVNVESSASISTGTGNARHQLNLYGDFTNNGTVAFTNRTLANYGSEAVDGIVDVNFLDDSKGQSALLNGPSNFYRIEIDKGTDDTYALSLEASNANYFKLYGYAGENHGSVAQLTDNNNALGLIKGTARIKSNISIPVLNNSGNYNVSENARLWVDGGTVKKTDGTAIVPYGKIRVSAGFLESSVSSGITIRGNGLVKVEGGKLTINQLRTSVFGSENVGGYVQSGGTTNILGGNTSTDYYCFNLTYPGNVFNMSGGSLHIHEAHGKGGIFIASDETNYNVTGGTVIMEISDGNDFPITSTAPFGSVILRNSSAGAGEHILSAGTDVGATNENLPAQPLVVLNDLTIESDAFLNHDGNDLYVGRDFDIDPNAQTRSFDNSGIADSYNDYNIGYLYDPLIPNTTVFNGASDGEFYIGYNSSDGFEQYFHDFKVEKSEGSRLTIVCDDRKSAKFQDDNNRNHWHARLLRIENELNVESGILDQGRSAFRLYGPVGIGENGQCGEWIPGVTHPWAWFMLKDADLNINTEPGAIIGNIKMNPNPQTDIINFSSDVYIKRIGYFHGRINLQSYELKLDYLVDGLTNNNYDIGNGNGNDEMFYSSGNASDGGLLLYVPAGTTDGTTFPYPLGVLSKYTPAEIALSNVSDDGYIRITPVEGELQTTDLSGGDLLSYAWRVDYEGFTSIPTVEQLRLIYNNADVVGNENNYVAGKVLDEYPFSRIYEDATIPESEGVNTGNNTIIFNGQTDNGFTLEKAFYTAGESNRFVGSPQVFFLRRNGDWNNGSTWSLSRGGGAAGDYPKSGDVAIIRRSSASYSGIVTVRQPEQAAAVVFDDENGWSSGCPRIIFDTQNNYAAYNSNFGIVDVADSHEGGTLDYNTHGAVIQYNIEDNYSNASSSLKFDGSNDYVAIQNYNYSGGGHTAFTVECWVKTTDGGDQVIASFDRNQFWRLEVNGNGAGTGQVGFDIMSSSGQLDFGGSTRIDDGAWHHIAGVFNNGTVTLYIDGVIDNTTTTGATFGSGATRYGFLGVGSEADNYNGAQGPNDYFNGNISEFRVWSTARTQAQIQNSMNMALSGTESGLEIYYPLDGVDAEVNAADNSSNGNNGVLFNFTLPGAWVSESPMNSAFPGGDFGGFNQYPNALVIYAWDGASANADVTLSKSATEYPQMWFAGGNNSRTLRFPDTDVTVHGGFTVPGNAIIVANGDSDNTLTMEQNVNIGHNSLGAGKLLFPGNATGKVTLEIKKDLNLRGDANTVMGIEDAGGGTQVHRLKVGGDIVVTANGGQIQLGSGNTSESNVELELYGNGKSSFTNTVGALPQFYRIITNKGVDTTSAFSFNNSFSLTGFTDGVGRDKAVELQNGKFILNHPAINVDLTTGDDDFYIPGTAGLEVRQGQANANGNSGILLDGNLEVSGGTIDMSGGNNYIHYSASGNASIDVSSGSLIVGSQIRRGLTSSEGILKYTQSGGTVVVGNDAAPENDRGVFEVLNTNSNFRLTGGDLYIARAQTSPGTAALYLNPETSNVDAAATIFIGHTNTPANQTIGVYSTIDLPNFTVVNSSNNNPVAQMWTIPLTINNNLDIQAGASFDANGLDLTLNGDITINGAFVANNNTTFFSSNTTQQITGSPAFFNITKNASGTLSLNNDVTIHNVFRHQSGVLSDNSNTLSVKGNLEFNGDHNWGGAGDGILMNGIQQQMLQGSGTFGKLTVDNSEGIFVPEGNPINIQGALQLENGVLDIGKNLLVLAINAAIIEGNVFSDQNMIQTNISFTDAGVKKFFPAIAPSDNYNFIYPIGSEGKYTPVSFNISEKDAGGYIRVKAANEMHPTILNDNEPCQEIHDTSNVLKYHWLLEASAVSNFTGSVNMNYYSEDFQLDNSKTGTSYTVADYITARLLLGSTLWNKYGPDSFDENSQTLLFDFTNTDDEGISGEYTAGIEDQAGACEGAIPDEVPAYISKQDGDWNDIATWDTYPVSGGSIPVGGPRGAIVIVEHNVFVPKNYIVSYKTIINNTGLLDIGSSFGHRLGIVEGTGTLKLERGDLPAGVYDNFFSRSGGTIEFAGNTNYDILSEVSHVRNLKFSGTGERRFPNLDFEVYGLFAIDGVAPTLEVINEHDRNVILDSNVVFNQGRFDAGVEPSTVTFNGTEQQLISGTGSFTGINAFRNVVMNNSNGVTLSSPVEIQGSLAFISGIITTTATNILTVDNASETAVSGYSSLNYVDGPMRKLVQNNGNFEFPVGNAGRYGPVAIYNTTNASSAYWTAEYINSSHIDNTFTGNLAAVSTNEYWEITNPTAGDAAEVELRWDSNSDITPLSTGNINEIVVAEYDGINWVDKASNSPSGDNYDGTVKTTNAINVDPKQYTLGATIIIQGKAYFNSLDDVCSGTDIPVYFSGVDATNLNYTLYYDYFDGVSTTSNSVTINSLPYSLPTTDGPGIYTLTAFEYNSGLDAGTVDGSMVAVNPVPVQYNVTGGGNYCSGGSGVTVGLDGSDLGVNYELFVGTTSLGIYAGTGAALDFGNQTTGGTYTVEATDASGICSQSMIGSVDVIMNPLPTAILTVNTAQDNICNGDNTEIEINFTAGTIPFNFTVRRTDEFSTTDDQALSGISSNSYTYIPATAPIWLDDGTPDTEYTYNVISITDANGCTNTATQGSAQVTVFKVPETGPQYHISNEHAK